MILKHIILTRRRGSRILQNRKQRDAVRLIGFGKFDSTKVNKGRQDVNMRGQAVHILRGREIPFRPVQEERHTMSAIEKAIQKSDLGLNPVNDGKIIRVPIPALNEERRRELVKVVHTHAEHSKVGVRNARRDGNEQLKRMQKDSTITEDVLRHLENDNQKLTDTFIHTVDELIKKKEEEILSI